MLSSLVTSAFDFGIYGDEVTILWETAISPLTEETGSQSPLTRDQGKAGLVSTLVRDGLFTR